MDGMTGGSFTLQVMCGFKIQLFLYVNLYLSFISSVSCFCTDSVDVIEGRQMKEDGGQRRAECEASHSPDKFTVFKQSQQLEVKQSKPLISLLISQYWHRLDLFKSS